MKDKLFYARDYLLNKGLTQTAVTAILGNFVHESGMETDIQEKGHTQEGWGLAQWGGERKAALHAFAKKQGRPATDMDVQLDFTVKELKHRHHRENGKITKYSQWDVLNSYDDYKVATKYFMDQFEMPLASTAREDLRQNYANSVWNSFQGIVPTTHYIDREKKRFIHTPEFNDIKIDIPKKDSSQLGIRESAGEIAKINNEPNVFDKEYGLFTMGVSALMDSLSFGDKISTYNKKIKEFKEFLRVSTPNTSHIAISSSMNTRNALNLILSSLGTDNANQTEYIASTLMGDPSRDISREYRKISNIPADIFGRLTMPKFRAEMFEAMVGKINEREIERSGTQAYLDLILERADAIDNGGI